MAKEKRSYSGDAKIPRYPLSGEKQAAEWLRDMAKAFLADKALAADVDEAVENWVKARGERSGS